MCWVLQDLANLTYGGSGEESTFDLSLLESRTVKEKIDATTEVQG